MNKEKLDRIQTITIQIFWWVIVLIYTVAYVLYMPKSTFGSSEFSLMFWAMNFLTGLYLLLKTGGLIK